MENTNERILEKIKKCLRLAASSDGNEAATALRQAQALMREHQLDMNAVELSDVDSVYAKAGWGQEPPMYFSDLVQLIRFAFGVDAVFHVKQGKTDEVEYIGIGSQAELAAYAHDVLRRQLVRGRSDYLKTLKRFKRANKTRRADLFAEQWVRSVRHTVVAFAQTEEQKQLITRYKKTRYENLETANPRTHDYLERDYDAARAGYAAGRDVRLHRAAGYDQRDLLECNV